MNNKVLLIIRDGWGFRREDQDNLIALANTPNNDRYEKEYPNALLKTSGRAVGLPDGYQGNSEVGHLTIGSGRIILQSMQAINQAIENNSFFENAAFLNAIENCRKNNSNLHILGLLQTQGVHSHINHLFALLELCKRQKFENVYIHIITDGRDAPVNESIKHVKNLIQKMEFGKIVSVCGRYYAMDRDNRWDRTELAYECIADGYAKEFDNVLEQIEECHSNQETDEFIKPRKLKGYQGVKNGDSIIFFNFRTDRTRQLTKAFIENDFDFFKRDKKEITFVAMTEYYQGMNCLIAFKSIKEKNLLGECISEKGFKQLRISETEKYAHVTFFFNGQNEKESKNEKRILISSPQVATYDLQPEMSVFKIADTLCKEIECNDYNFIVTNLVNCDMVGHTGNREAILKAVESVDKATGEIVDCAVKKGYSILLFADHGNAEDFSPEWRTSHTTNPVPLILITDQYKGIKGGELKDIAPTVLDIMEIEKPKEMTGESLIIK